LGRLVSPDLLAVAVIPTVAEPLVIDGGARTKSKMMMKAASTLTMLAALTNLNIGLGIPLTEPTTVIDTPKEQTHETTYDMAHTKTADTTRDKINDQTGEKTDKKSGDSPGSHRLAVLSDETELQHAKWLKMFEDYKKDVSNETLAAWEQFITPRNVTAKVTIPALPTTASTNGMVISASAETIKQTTRWLDPVHDLVDAVSYVGDWMEKEKCTICADGAALLGGMLQVFMDADGSGEVESVTIASTIAAAKEAMPDVASDIHKDNELDKYICKPLSKLIGDPIANAYALDAANLTSCIDDICMHFIDDVIEYDGQTLISEALSVMSSLACGCKPPFQSCFGIDINVPKWPAYDTPEPKNGAPKLPEANRTKLNVQKMVLLSTPSEMIGSMAPLSSGCMIDEWEANTTTGKMQHGCSSDLDCQGFRHCNSHNWCVGEAGEFCCPKRAAKTAASPSPTIPDDAYKVAQEKPCAEGNVIMASDFCSHGPPDQKNIDYWKKAQESWKYDQKPWAEIDVPKPASSLPPCCAGYSSHSHKLTKELESTSFYKRDNTYSRRCIAPYDPITGEQVCWGSCADMNEEDSDMHGGYYAQRYTYDDQDFMGAFEVAYKEMGYCMTGQVCEYNSWSSNVCREVPYIDYYQQCPTHEAITSIPDVTMRGELFANNLKARDTATLAPGHSGCPCEQSCTTGPNSDGVWLDDNTNDPENPFDTSQTKWVNGPAIGPYRGGPNLKNTGQPESFDPFQCCVGAREYTATSKMIFSSKSLMKQTGADGYQWPKEAFKHNQGDEYMYQCTSSDELSTRGSDETIWEVPAKTVWIKANWSQTWCGEDGYCLQGGPDGDRGYWYRQDSKKISEMGSQCSSCRPVPILANNGKSLFYDFDMTEYNKKYIGVFHVPVQGEND
jgi:hypothetical protein